MPENKAGHGTRRAQLLSLLAISHLSALGSCRVGERQAAAGSNEAKGRCRGEAVSDTSQNSVGSPTPIMWDCLEALLMPP